MTSVLAATPPFPSTRLLARAAAWLLLFAFLTGFYAAAGMTGKLPINGRMALAAHVTALLGTFILLGVAWSQPLVRYSETGQRRMAWLFIVPTYAGWFFTAVKAAFSVSGIDLTGEPANDTIFGILNALVVLPSLVAAGAWVYGLHGERSDA